MTETVPVMAIPALCTANLTRLLGYYRDGLVFQVIQEIRGVVALLQHGSLRLQLWQRVEKLKGDARIRLDGRDANVFQIHAMLARHALSALGEESPRLRPWGAWEFSLTDLEGIQLTFVQWVIGSGFGRVQEQADNSQRQRHEKPHPPLWDNAVGFALLAIAFLETAAHLPPRLITRIAMQPMH